MAAARFVHGVGWTELAPPVLLGELPGWEPEAVPMGAVAFPENGRPPLLLWSERPRAVWVGMIRIEQPMGLFGAEIAAD